MLLLFDKYKNYEILLVEIRTFYKHLSKLINNDVTSKVSLLELKEKMNKVQ